MLLHCKSDSRRPKNNNIEKCITLLPCTVLNESWLLMVSPILYFNKVCWNLRCVKHNYWYSKLIKYSVWQLFAISHLILTADFFCVLYKTAGEGTADCQQRAMLSVLHLPVWVSTRRPLHQDTLLPLLPLSLFGKTPANLAADLRRGTRQAASLATYQHLSSETMRKST